MADGRPAAPSDGLLLLELFSSPILARAMSAALSLTLHGSSPETGLFPDHGLW
jgi:hypothetical protein